MQIVLSAVRTNALSLVVQVMIPPLMLRHETGTWFCLPSFLLGPVSSPPRSIRLDSTRLGSPASPQVYLYSLVVSLNNRKGGKDDVITWSQGSHTRSRDRSGSKANAQGVHVTYAPRSG